MHTKVNTVAPRYAIIGAGFAGLTAAIRLSRAGADVTVYDRADGVGGVWRANRYPGAACDVPSFLYSWSFAPKTDWTRRFAGQAEILDYIENTVDRFGVRHRIRTGHDVSQLTWDDAISKWTLSFVGGMTATADFVVAALGQMSTPAIPALPGTDTFSGELVHTAQWRDDLVLDDRDIVVLGAGASAVQVVPAIAEQARSVSVIQRSAGYVLGKDDAAYDRRQSLVGSKLARYRGYLSKELQTPRLVRWPRFVAPAERAYRRDLRGWVADDALLAKLQPEDRYGCKRILVSNEWYPALARRTVHLYDEVVSHLTSDAVVLRDGTRLPADVVVYGTGFQASSFLHGIEVRGAGGRLLDQEWRQTPRAYLGMTVPNLPNLFLMYGPNTNPAWNSVLMMLECQVRYLTSTVRRWQRVGRFAMEVKAGVAQHFAQELRSRTSRTVWVTGCRNWYLAPDGTNTQNWPALVTEYWWRTRRVRWSDYTVTTTD